MMIWKSGVSPCIIDKYLDHMVVKFEQNRMVQTVQNRFVLFDKKWLTIFDKVLMPRSCDWNNGFMVK